MPDNDLRPKEPETLKAIGMSKWNEIIDSHWPDRIKQADLPLLEMYCGNYQRYVEAENTLAEQDHVISSHTGAMYPNPYVGISNKCLQNLAKLAKMLGLCPLDKAKSKGSPVKTAAFTPRSRN